jgi:hypothetical protein
MRILWLALWLAILGWDALSPHLVGASPRLGTAALVLAGAILTTPWIRRGPWFSPSLALPVAAGSAVAGILLPWPESLGFLLVAAGCVVASIPMFGLRVRGAVFRGVAGLGALVVLLATTSHLYGIVESQVQGRDVLSRPLALLYRVLGVGATADPPFVHIESVGRLVTVGATFDKVIGQPLALFVVAGLFLLVVVRGRETGWRCPLVLLGSAAGFAVVRALALGLAVSEVGGPSIYWLRGWVMGGLLALVGVMALVSSPGAGVSTGLGASRERGATWRGLFCGQGSALVAAAALFGATAAGSLGFFDAGTPKDGRILIDERHSNWAWSTVALNTESYGTQTVYNYSEMLRFLGHFYEAESSFAAITDTLLESTSLLVLKTPTRPYEDEEVEAIVRFVERGGGLWLIGDHTNIFGMSTNLNKVGRRFGVRYRYDAAIDLMTGGRQLFERPRLFSHPSIAHLPPVLMATSCSVAAPTFSRRVMLGRSLLADELDYSVNTFFGNFAPDPHEPFGSVLQAVATTRGRGRVLVFSDSTIFSNFFFMIRGKSELALGSAAWLMRENRWAWVRPVLLIGAGLALVWWLVLAAARPRGIAIASIGIGTAPAFALVAVALGAWVSGWSSLPAPEKPLPWVAFMRERTAFHIPEKTNLPDESPHSYHTFYIWTERVGYFPRTDRLADCLEGSEAVVIINPRGSFTEDTLADLRAYVEAGGGLLVMDRPYIEESTANDALAPFGLALEAGEIDSVTAWHPAAGDSVVLVRAGRVTGGEPFLLLPDGTAAAAVAEAGEGRVVALAGSDNFADSVMGTTSQVPDERQLALYRLQFRIFDELLRPRGEIGGDGAGEAAGSGSG